MTTLLFIGINPRVLFVPGVLDANFDGVVTDWFADVVSDPDSDSDEVFAPELAPQPAFDFDMRETELRVLEAEDRLNNMATRELVTDMTQDGETYCFDWRSNREHFRGQRETFTGRSGPTFDLSEMTPIDIFDLMFDHNFIDNLVTETNRYAQQKLGNTLKPSSRLRRWTATGRDEMVSFLALLRACTQCPKKKSTSGTMATVQCLTSAG